MPIQHLPEFIRDLAIILMSAGMTSILFRWLKQPAILGYVAAGFMVGPHLSITPTVSDIASVKIWGEIGVIFVLFSLGLEFSFRRLMRVGGPAVVTASIETSLLLLLGTLIGLMLGWSRMDAIFLGGMLCISSTMIIMKIFEEQGVKARSFAQLVTGVLIVEDLVAVLLLVLLSTLAATRELAGGELAMVTLRLGFFLIVWFVVGLFLLPAIMRFVRNLLTAETSLIFSVGLCLMMVLVATETGFSPALGAFVMGSLLAETDEGHRIEQVVHPLRHFFGAVFFVSVGMLLDPKVLLQWWPAVLGITAFLIVAKTVVVSAGALIAGQTPRTAIRAGLSMTQIGEFSFIIAGLGLSLKVISPELYPIAVGVSLLTIITSPILVRHSDSIYARFEKTVPQRWLRAIENYDHAVRSQQGDRMLPALLRAYLPLILVNSVLILAMTGLVRYQVYPRIESIAGPSSSTRLVGALIDLLLCLPFFWGLCMRRPGRKWRETAPAYVGVRWLEMILAIFRIFISILLMLLIVAQYTSWRSLSGFAIALFAGLGFLFYAFGGKIYRRLERRFLGQLSRSEEVNVAPPLLPWDAHLTELVVSPESPVCGQTIEKLGFNESFNVMIAAVDRGKTRILAPRGSTHIFPHDKISVIGSDADIERLKRLVSESEHSTTLDKPLRLQSLILSEKSRLCGIAIRDSGLREKVEGLLVGLEREGYRRLNPPADLRLESGDRLWIVGDPEKISRLNQ